jgi:hypothetical protein
MKRTLEKFVLPYVNAVFSITTTFDLWINKSTLDNFAPMIFLKHWIGNQNMSQFIYLRQKTLLK